MRKVLVTLVLVATAALGLGGVANAATNTYVVATSAMPKGSTFAGSFKCPNGGKFTGSSSRSNGASVIEYSISGVYHYKVTAYQNNASFKATLTCTK